MKELTLGEFQDRLKAIDRAMKIFSELTENNINRAFIAYQKITISISAGLRRFRARNAPRTCSTGRSQRTKKDLNSSGYAPIRTAIRS
jgi:hypothetical protein